MVATPRKIDRNSPNKPTGLQAAFLQKKSQHGGSGGLPMGAGDNQIAGSVKKPTPEQFRQGNKGYPVGQDGFQFRIPAGKGITHNGQVGLGGEIFLGITFVKDDAPFASEKIRHGGVNSLVGSRDLQADLAEHGRHGSHAGSGNPEEVEVFKMGAI